jgi:inositol transporter-like SP family MFS transporter
LLVGYRQNPMGEERVQWRRTLLAAMANYIDAGSIVAGAVSLPIWAAYFGFGDSFVSFLGAFSSNAIAAGLGALIGGRICDLLGRKKIYQWDLLLYAFGTLWIVFAFQEWMLLVGFFIVGLTVGADVPASWTLITDTAPSKSRGRFGTSGRSRRCCSASCCWTSRCSRRGSSSPTCSSSR